MGIYLRAYPVKISVIDAYPPLSTGLFDYDHVCESIGIVHLPDEAHGKEIPDLLIYGLLPFKHEASPFLVDQSILGIDVQH